MHIEVAVMYGDLSILKVPWELKHTLRRDSVLSIAVVHANKPNRRKRQQAVCEYDYYVLAWTESDCYLGGYNDDFYWFSLSAPWKPYGEGFVHRFPYVLPECSMLFEGVMVPPERYEAAKAIFTDQEGPMF